MTLGKKLFIFLALVIPSFFTYAQYESNTIQLNPYGDDYREPKVYGTGSIAPAPTPTPEPLPAVGEPAPPVKNTPIVTTPTDLFETQKKDTSFFGNLLSQKLKMEAHGVSKDCTVGGERSIPWILVNNGVGIDTKEELQAILDQAIKADPRIRKISIKENILDMYYLEPARLFSIIPVNYLYHVTIDTTTNAVTIQDPKWLSFATQFHTQTTTTLSSDLSRVFTPGTLAYTSVQNIYYRHAFAIAAVAHSMDTVNVYPFANTFWICYVIPYFVLFLVLLGALFGFILYIWAKRKKDLYIRRIQRVDSPASQFAPLSKPAPREKNPRDDDDSESLEDYVKSKRFK